MTPISDLFGPTAAPPPPAAAGSALGRDEFLKLLVAQLSNQDPLSPQAGHEFAAQLAQFASVEQLSAIGATLSGHTAQLAALANAVDAAAVQRGELGAAFGRGLDLSAATALIGQGVEVRTDRVTWDGTTPPVLGLDLGAEASQVTVTIRNAEGEIVRVLSPGALGSGPHTLSWDGADADGEPLAPGTYHFEVTATDATGGAVAAERFTRGVVERLTIEGDGVRLWIGGVAVALSHLRGVVGAS